MNYDVVSKPNWICLACGALPVGSDLVMVETPSVIVSVKELRELKSVADIVGASEIDERLLRCPTCCSSKLKNPFADRRS